MILSVSECVSADKSDLDVHSCEHLQNSNVINNSMTYRLERDDGRVQYGENVVNIWNDRQLVDEFSD